jgi:PTS system mannose-specific IID component
MTAAARSYPAPDPAPRVSPLTWLSVFVRTLAIQGSWNYETLLGNGVGFALEPVLRQLPSGVPPERIERFRSSSWPRS